MRVRKGLFMVRNNKRAGDGSRTFEMLLLIMFLELLFPFLAVDYPFF